ncbi:hypothetical protein RI367_004003 [Sorochytrium milnesiophthora]
MADDSSSTRTCWICYAEESPALSRRRWCTPCKCKGSLGYAHERCLLNYIDSRVPSAPYSFVRFPRRVDAEGTSGGEDGNSNSAAQSSRGLLLLPNMPKCPQCNTQYRVVCARSPSFALLTTVRSLAATTTPYIMLMSASLGVLFLSTTYGAYTVLTVAGADGERWLTNSAWGLRLWSSLPLIPVALVGARTNFLDGILPLLPLFALDLNFSYSLRSAHSHSLFSPAQPVSSLGIFNFYRHLEPNTLWPPSPSAVLLVLPIVRHSYNRLLDQLYRYMFPQVYASQRTAKYSTAPAAQGPEAEAAAAAAAAAAEPVVDGVGPEADGDAESDSDQPSVYDDERRLLSLTTPNSSLPSLVVGALMFPMISAMSGALLRSCIPGVSKHFPSQFLQSVLGGCVFVAAKDAATVYYVWRRRQLWLRRRVLDYGATD